MLSFEDNKEIPSDLTECLLNNGCLETSQNSSLIDPLTNFEENKSTIFDDNQTQNMFKDNNFIQTFKPKKLDLISLGI